MKRFLFALFALALATLPARAGGDVGYPPDTFAIASASGNVANGAAIATLIAPAGHRAYICGLSVMGAGATAAITVLATVTGTMGGGLSYNYSVDTAVGVVRPPLQLYFNPCLPAATAGTNIVVTLPALGAGNTNASATAWGFVQ